MLTLSNEMIFLLDAISQHLNDLSTHSSDGGVLHELLTAISFLIIIVAPSQRHTLLLLYRSLHLMKVATPHSTPSPFL